MVNYNQYTNYADFSSSNHADYAQTQRSVTDFVTGATGYHIYPAAHDGEIYATANNAFDEADTLIYTPVGSGTVSEAYVLREYDDTLYMAALFNTGTTYEYNHASTTDLSGWSVTSDTFVDSPSGKNTAVDIFQHSGTVYVAYVIDYDIEIRPWDNSTGWTDVSAGRPFPGCYSNGKWTYGQNASGSTTTLELREFDLDTKTYSYKEDVATEAAGTFNPDVERSFYWEQDGNKMVLHNNTSFVTYHHFFWYDKVTEEWVMLDSTTEKECCGPMWGRDIDNNYRVNEIFFDKQEYKLFGGNGVFLGQDPLYWAGSADMNFKGGMGEFYQNDRTINKLFTKQAITTKNAITPFLTKALIDARAGTCTLKDQTAVNPWTTDEYVSLADPNGVTCFEGVVDQIEYVGGGKAAGSRTVKLISLKNYDFKIKYTGDFTDATACEILESIIGEKAQFLKWGGSTSTTEYTISFKDKSFDWIIKMFEGREGKKFRVSAVNVCYFDDGTTDTGITVAYGDYPIEEVNYKKQIQKKSVIILRGKYVDGVRLTSTKKGDNMTYGTYFDSFPEIDTQAALDAQAVQILADKDKQILHVTPKISELGWIDYGKQMTFSYSPYTDELADFGTPGAYFINNVIYDLLRDAVTPDMSDALYIKPAATNGTSAVNNEQMIGDIEDNTNSSEGQGITPSRIKVDSEDEYGKGIWAGVVDWGTSGTPTGWSRTETGGTMSIISSYDGHNYPVFLDKTGVGNCYMNKSTSKQYYSYWLNSTNAALQSWVAIKAGAVYYYWGIDNDVARYYDGTEWVGPAVLDDTWYHFAIELDATNNIVRCYLNGTLVYTKSVAISTVDTIFLAAEAGAYPYEVYMDALVESDTFEDIWCNYGDGHQQIQSLSVASGQGGEVHPYNGTLHLFKTTHSLEYYGWTTVTGTHVREIDYKTGAVSNISGTWAGSYTNFKDLIPDGTKYIYIRLQATFTAGTWNRNNKVGVTRTDISIGGWENLEVSPDNGYEYYMAYGFVPVDKDGKIHVIHYCDSGAAASIFGYVHILGYVI